MPDWRAHNPSNQADTCLWCGNKLRQGKGMWVDDPTAVKGQRFDADALRPKRGDYADGLFCGLRCGYLFGKQMAAFGHRIAPRKAN